MDTQLNVGLVGYGVAGRVFHAPLIAALPQLHLKSVVERHTRLAEQRYPSVHTARHLDELLADLAIDLVVIATPNESHFPQAQQALQAGKHVVLDKPFTVTSTEADALIALARQVDRRLTVFHNRRWDGDFRTVQQLLAAGRLGRLATYEANFDRFRPGRNANAWREAPRPGAGLLYDLGVHLIDQALQLFGWPQSLTAHLYRQREAAEVDDAFSLRLDYGQHQAILQASMLARAPRPRFALYGTQGSFVKQGLDPQESALRAGQVPAGDSWGHDPAGQWGQLHGDIDGLPFQGQIETLPGDYRAFYQNVYAAITGPEALAVLPTQARDTIRLIELARQSHQEQRTLRAA